MEDDMEGGAPLVSVVIPAYNSGRYIGEAVNSVLDQTCMDFEIIVVDDGSTDDTGAKLRRYGDCITYIYQRNEGPASSRNRGIRASRGRYIAFLDSDDIWRPEKLELQVKFMERNPQLGFCFTDAIYFGEGGERIASFFGERRIFHQIEGSSDCGGEKVFAHKVWKELFLENFIVTSTVMIRRECFDVIGFFDEAFFNGEDFELWFRLAREYLGGVINEPLILKRFHQTNISTIDDRVLGGLLRVRRKIIISCPEVSQVLGEEVSRIMKNSYFGLGYWYFDHRQLGQARQNFLKSLRHKFDIKILLYIISTYFSPFLIKIVRKIKRRVHR